MIITAERIGSPVIKPNLFKITYEDKREIDEVIEQFIRKGNKYKFLTQLSLEALSMLLTLYGNKKSVTIWRGLNFSTLDTKYYKQFLKSLEDGYYVDNKVSSWTLNRKVAEQFSKVNDAQEYNQAKYLFNAEKTFDAAGVLLKQKIKPYEGIIIPYNNAPGFKYEREVLLLPGKYSIDIEDYDVLIED